MAQSQITSLKVTYPKGDKKNLTAEIKFSIPASSGLKNPDNNQTLNFPYSSNGRSADIIMDFKEVPSTSTPSTRTKKITMKAYITLAEPFTIGQDTIANLILNGTPVSSKSQSAADYNEDPEEEIRGVK